MSALVSSWATGKSRLPVQRSCELLGVSRATFYRYRQATRRQAACSDPCAAAALLAAIEAIAVEFPGYGYRRVTAQLNRDGIQVNHKRVLRLMREHDLLCRLPTRWVKTTNSNHGLSVYANLLFERGWTRLTGINQAWVADLTYIRLERDFCYLAAILDAYSRRVVGWSLSATLAAEVALAALERALSTRAPAPGWIHHSDRGVQYACRDYVARVLAAGGRVSMAARGTPRDNAQAESFIRTLKHEGVYLNEYRTLAEAEAGIGQFIEAVYNEKRLHSALGYRPPSEFEELLAAGALC